MTKLADWYDNSVTREMHKKLGSRGWQWSKIDLQQLGPEFRQPLIKKKYDIFSEEKIDLCKNRDELR